VDRAAGSRHLRLVGLDVEVEVLERVLLDVTRAVAQILEFGQRGGRGGALGCRLSSARARWAFSLNCGEVG
jgi:hypothetical protein